tara:strand:+ start:2824 stop:3021 length:198 start_codon:yes stop_codon:yes gene_type:complete
MVMNLQTKLMYALNHVAHLHDLIEDNPFEKNLKENLIIMEVEFERQLKNELERKNLQHPYHEDWV